MADSRILALRKSEMLQRAVERVFAAARTTASITYLDELVQRELMAALSAYDALTRMDPEKLAEPKP
jgi:hypothetical protein